MNKQLPVWKLIAESLHHQIPVMLLYVLESSGSSPGRQGFLMAVNGKNESDNHRMAGSIGGGIMEHKFVEMAEERLRVMSSDPIAMGSSVTELRKQIHDKAAAKNQSGMICSGEQTILLYHVQKEDQDRIEQIISSLEQNKNGTLKLSPAGIEFSSSIPKENFEFSIRSEQDWQYTEKTGYKNQLFIIGGGHCALAFSNLMSEMDFYIRLYDERENLKTVMENKSAHEKHFINDYSELSNIIPAGNNHYVVIMTFGYRTDDAALRAVIDKEFKYLGLLGSKSKIEKMFDDYRRDGFEEMLFQRVHGPIGVGIKSQTPEEIAVSIAAEIIKVKNQDL